MVIQTCPNCEGVLLSYCLPSSPPQYRVQCPKCGFDETTKEKVIIQTYQSAKSEQEEAVEFMEHFQPVSERPPKFTEEQIEAIKIVLEWAYDGMIDNAGSKDIKYLKIVKDMLGDVDWGDWDWRTT